MAVSSPNPSSPALYHLSLNGSREETIILLHGFSSSHREYSFVQPYLASYHLLLPDLPGHGGSIQLPLQTLAGAADLVADLIRSKARGGRAHVVGLSMGGAIALLLAHRHSDIVNTLFVTGVPGNKGPPASSGHWVQRLVPYVLAAVKPLLWLPRPIQKWVVGRFGMKLPDGLIEDVRRNLKFSTSKTASAEIGKLDFGPLTSLRTRTLVVAGAARDSVEGIRRLGHIVKEGNPESRAIAIPGGNHTWDMQFPELFADCVTAWIRTEALPKTVEMLE